MTQKTTPRLIFEPAIHHSFDGCSMRHHNAPRATMGINGTNLQQKQKEA
jgi:hypothetical protein